jgi:hypothetical protein
MAQQVVSSFLQGVLTETELRDQYNDIWKAERDFLYSLQESWPRRFDLELQKQLGEGIISAESYHEQMMSLYGFSPEDDRVEEISDQMFGCIDDWTCPMRSADEGRLQSFQSELASLLAELEAVPE